MSDLTTLDAATEWRTVPAGEAFSILMGRQRSPSRTTGPNMTPYLRSANVGNGRLDLSDVKEMDFNDAERERFGLLPDDVLVSEGSASAKAVGMAAAWRGEISGDVCFQNTLLRYRAIPGVSDPGFCFQWCRWAYESGAFGAAASGTNIKHIGTSRAASMPVLLPPLDIQRRVAALLGAIDDLITALDDEADALTAIYQGSDTLLWTGARGHEEAPLRPLGEIMRLDISWTPIEIGATYRLAGVRNAGRGMVDRGAFDAETTKYERMNTLRAGQVVMRKLTAWEGPVTIVPETFDGYLASSEFPTFALTDAVSPSWMRHVCRTPRLWREMKSRVIGSVQRRQRLNPDQLLAINLPVPPRAIQNQAAESLDALDASSNATRAEAERLRRVRTGLLSALLSRQIEIASADEVGA